jgi:hypothetical protein
LDVEERFLANAVPDDHDPSGLLGDEQPPAPVPAWVMDGLLTDAIFFPAQERARTVPRPGKEGKKEHKSRCDHKMPEHKDLHGTAYNKDSTAGKGPFRF